MRAGTAFAALLGVASFGVAAWAQAPIESVIGTSPVYQDASCGCGAPAATSCGCDSGCQAGGPLRERIGNCLLYTSPSPRDATLSRMPSSA